MQSPGAVSQARSARRVLNIPSTPADSVGMPLLGGREAPAHIAFALRAERRPGCEPQSVLAHQALAEGETVAHAFDSQEGIHGAVRHCDFHLRYAFQLADQKIPGLAVTLQAFLNDRLPPLQGGTAGALPGPRRGRGGVL